MITSIEFFLLQSLFLSIVLFLIGEIRERLSELHNVEKIMPAIQSWKVF
ncbi:MAG: hypothetical protein Q8L68_07660 [Methylococcales bacterium]|nr:hypothetical protein [Methylococcales bacterium]